MDRTSRPPVSGTEPSPEGPDERLQVSRRGFLKIGTVAAAVTPGLIGACAEDDLPTSGEALTLTPDSEFTILRKEDLLALTVGLVNLQVDETTGTLVRKDNGKAAYFIVNHQPQHVLEQSFLETGGAPPVAPGPQPVLSRIAGPSRVVFIVPTGTSTLDFKTETLLAAFAQYEMSVGLNALPPDVPPPLFLLDPVLLNVAGTEILKPAYGVGPSPLVPKLGPPGPLPIEKVTRALVCAEDGQPPRVTALNFVQAARNTRGWSIASRLTGIELLPEVIRDAGILQIKPTRPRKPASGETSLEIPFRLSISPNKFGRWAHATTPVTSPMTGRTELWHSRLGVQKQDEMGNAMPTDEHSTFYRTVRALWTRDVEFKAAEPKPFLPQPSPLPWPTPAPAFVSNPFLASLNQHDRNDIVHQSSNFEAAKLDGYRARPVQINRLMLTTLGAYMDARGDFGDEPPLGLSLWEHRAALGRDHYVKIVRTGVLYPFGHRAVVIKISERKFKREPMDHHEHIAYVRTRYFIVVKQPELIYEKGREAGPTVPILRKNPFKMLHFKTLVTPPLEGSESDLEASSFWPVVGGEKFRFHVEGLDLGGNFVKFSTPVYFMRTDGIPPKTVALPTVGSGNFNGKPETECDLHGQRMALAPATVGKVDDTTYEVKSLRFEGENLLSVPSGYKFPFFPVVAEAKLAVEAVRQLAGAGAAPSFKYHQTFVDHGFGGTENPGEVLFELTNYASKIGVDFSKQTDRSGGLVSPSLMITALSRKIGPVAGDQMSVKNSAAKGKFDPKKFFEGVDAKLFGTFNLTDILPLDLLLEHAPKFVTQALDVAETFMEEVQKLKSAFDKAVNQLNADFGSLEAAEKALMMALGKLATDIEAIVNNITARNLSGLATALGTLGTDLVAAANTLPTLKLTTLAAGFKAELVKDAKAIKALIDGNLVTPIEALAKGLDLAKNLRVHLEWKPRIAPFGFTAGKPIFEPMDVDNGLTLALDLRGKDLPGSSPAGVDILCSLDKFKLNLIAPATFMVLEFKKIQFKVESGKKPDIDVQFKELTFAGPLEFVNELKQLIPFDGFSDPPAIDVSLEGIKASFSVALPNVAVGVFALQNISLGGGFHIPFIGPPLTVSFNFCTRENPFNLTVSFLGGGGFFGITLYPKGVYLMEAALEFGASLSVDFGVASGSVSIMAGIYFKMQTNDITLTGYLRIRGEVDVLGLISASIEMRMELTYQSAGNKVIGKATIEIEVDIFFFSFTVAVSAERKFAGDKADPTFEQIMGPEPVVATDPWAEYQLAFAA